MSFNTASGPDNAGRDTGVEYVVDPESPFTIETPQVVVGRVDDLLDAVVGENRAQGLRAGSDRDRIDDVRTIHGRNLDQAELFGVPMTAVPLGVERDPWFGVECFGEAREVFCGLDDLHG